MECAHLEGETLHSVQYGNELRIQSCTCSEPASLRVYLYDRGSPHIRFRSNLNDSMAQARRCQRPRAATHIRRTTISAWNEYPKDELSFALTGAKQITLEGVYHSPLGAVLPTPDGKPGRPWYGSPSVIGWWVQEIWRDADELAGELGNVHCGSCFAGPAPAAAHGHCCGAHRVVRTRLLCRAASVGALNEADAVSRAAIGVTRKRGMCGGRDAILSK